MFLCAGERTHHEGQCDNQPELALHAPDQLAHRRLGHVEAVGRPPEVQLLGHGDEVAQMTKLRHSREASAPIHTESVWSQTHSVL